MKSLTGGQRRLANLSGGDLNVLFLQSVENIGGGQLPLRHAARIEPQTHGVFALTKNHHVANSGDALHGVFDVDVQVIAEEQAVVRAAIGINTGGKNEAAELLGDDDAGVFDFVGKTAEGLVDAVLDVNGSEVDVAGYIKGDRDLAAAVISAGGGDVFHTLHAVDGLLERNGDGGLDGLGVGADIAAGDDDLGRSKIWELRDGQSGDGNRAAENNHQGADSGENRAANEEINEQKRRPPSMKFWW